MSVDPHPATAVLAATTAADLAADLVAGRTTSVAVVTALLERIDALDGPGDIHLRAVIATAPDALAEAARLDAERTEGTTRGPLHGVPVLVKDNIEARGLPASAGSLALLDRPAQRDAPLVAALREAGLVVLGATNLSEWANIRSTRSTSGWSGVRGLTGNPWALDRSAGGSSSGSGASVAAGYAPLAIGTETDGSIVCPASLNGVVGLKPTVGRVPVEGVVPISGTQDSPGPMARSVLDAALLLDALTGTGEHTAAIGSLEAGDVRLAVATTWTTHHPGTDAAFERAIEALTQAGVSAAPVEAALPSPQANLDELTVMLCELVDDLGAYLDDRPGDYPASLADVVAFNRGTPEELAHFGQELFEAALDSGGRASAEYAEAAPRCRAWAVDECLEPALAGGAEFLVAPAYGPAWKSDLALGDHFSGGVATTAPAIAGWPVLSLPMAVVDGMPVGLAIVGRPGSEARLLAVGHVVEQVLGLAAGDDLRPAWAGPRRG